MVSASNDINSSIKINKKNYSAHPSPLSLLLLILCVHAALHTLLVGGACLGYIRRNGRRQVVEEDRLGRDGFFLGPQNRGSLCLLDGHYRGSQEVVVQNRVVHIVPVLKCKTPFLIKLILE